MNLKILSQILIYFFFTIQVFAETNIDQWQDSDKTYYDLIQDGFKVQAYDVSKIETDQGYLFMFFVTVLQKDNEVYECQEYQTLDENMQTKDLSFICRELVQPYSRGLET